MLLFFIVAAIGILPGLVWLIFFVEEDNRPEPLKDILITLLIAVLTTLVLAEALQILSLFLKNHGLSNLILDSKFSRPELFRFPEYATLLGLAFLEELVKFLAVFIGVRKLADFDQPVDVMVYLIVAAMGFAMVENIGANLQVVASSPAIGTVIQVTVIRFIGAALLHGLASGTMGYYWARGILKHQAGRYIVFGLFVATLLHVIFNYLIIINNLIVIPTLFLVIVAFFVFVDFEELKQIDKLPAQ